MKEMEALHINLSVFTIVDFYPEGNEELPADSNSLPSRIKKGKLTAI